MNKAISSAAGPNPGNPPPAWMQDKAFVEDLRRQMLRFARLQLADASLAEDAVQEALIGALRNAGGFAGRAAYKTWVFAILKNKIADLLRQRHRQAGANQPELHFDEEDPSELFDHRGAWQADARPGHWAHPEEALNTAQFWRVFEICLDNLPPQQARAFMMREFLGLETDEIRTHMALSVTNLNVILYRARLRLRACLEHRWFLNGEARQ